MLSKETIEGLRESVAKDLEAARVLDCAAGYVDRGWTQGHAAVDAEGLTVASDSPRACSWCMYGAMLAAFERLGFYGAEPLAVSVRSRSIYAAAVACLGREPNRRGNWAGMVTNWNDTVAMSGETVARTLRKAAGWVRLRIEAVQRAIQEAGG